MRIGSAVNSVENNPFASFIRGQELEESMRQQKAAATAQVTTTTQEEALKKVDEVQAAATESTFDMMDRHNDMVAKSQELQKVQTKKQAMQRMAQKEAEERRELMSEMATRSAERTDMLEAASFAR